MKKIHIIFSLLFVVIAFFYHLLGLMKMAPLYLTSPLLFFSIFITFLILNHKKTFRGF